MFIQLIQTVFVIVILYFLAILLKIKKILKEDDSYILAKIVTDLCLPAVVFINLARHSIKMFQMYPPFLMLFLEILFIAIAWIIARGLGFNKNKQGAIVFCSVFGSSTFLGYAVIMQMFSDNLKAMQEAVLISEIGVGYVIFILGPILAKYFASDNFKFNKKDIFLFFKTPVFFALILGMIWGNLGLPIKGNFFIDSLFHICKTLAVALTPLAILSIGLIFKIPRFNANWYKNIFLGLSIVIVMKLILKPILAAYLSNVFMFPSLEREVFIILSSMPPAILGVVFLKRYGSKESEAASFAANILLYATIISCVTILGIFYLTSIWS
jgi:predicted permease